MKKYLIYILVGLMPILGSCGDDFLTQTPDDLLTTETFYRNLSDAEAALATVYAQIGASDRWDVTEVNFVVEQFRSDMCMPGPDRYADWTAISTFTYTIGNSRFFIYWEDSYRGLNHANQVIEKVGAMGDEKIDPEQRNQIVAEAKFLRAFLHFRLLNNWEKIILKEKAPTSAEELSQGVSERSVVWALIESDLIDAANNLPETQTKENTGRATKGAAIGYLGKALLYQGKWSEAASEFKKLVDDGVGEYDLVDDYKSNFDGSNENNEESLFEIQYSPVRSNGRHIGHVLGKFTSASQTGGWGNIEATSNIVDEFKSEGMIATTGLYDTRMYETLFFDDPNIDVFGESFKDVFGDSEQIIYRKYTLSDRPESDNDPWYSSQNVPTMRFADVLLMYGEALNESSSADAAKPHVDRVRARADMPALPSGLSKEDMRQRIIHERAVELAYEGHRFFDLRRWDPNLLESKMQNSGKPGADNFVLSNHAYFPIPESETNTNEEL
ncbi:RagB/SusD family nutrient uptake outer membrane protein [Carboxylicivirga sp. N1Y90]|uniref:RagB/SusD family nutrient uptake outer membrane protein n=1 Tax=Carboxylicivirga fragile TaxID=3417571 RepID=UPI003D32D762|nr:RagB/SusD family nutrient uptake outer membrane protein [Marinilabiliaceae bacterium N1Y90]